MSLSEKFKKSNVGGVIHALRKNDKKIGQDDLSEKIGISQGTMSKIENGTLELSLSLYFELLECFDLTSAEFAQLVDTYIEETLRIQKLQIKDSQKKEKVSQEIAKVANFLRSAR